MPVAVVTGASRGLGLEITRELALQGWTTIVDARDPEALAGAMANVGPGRVVAIAGDIADPDHRADLVAAVVGAGGADLIVNNASVLGPSPQPTLDRYPLAELRTVYEVNVIAPLGLLQELLPHLHSEASVVNVTSDAAVEPYEGWGGYGSSKAALEQVTRIFGAENPSLNIYVFDPGDMRTKMHQDAFPGEDISDRPEPASVVPMFLRLIEERPPSGRYTKAELAIAERAAS